MTDPVELTIDKYPIADKKNVPKFASDIEFELMVRATTDYTFVEGVFALPSENGEKFLLWSEDEHDVQIVTTKDAATQVLRQKHWTDVKQVLVSENSVAIVLSNNKLVFLEGPSFDECAQMCFPFDILDMSMFQQTKVLLFQVGAKKQIWVLHQDKCSVVEPPPENSDNCTLIANNNNAFFACCGSVLYRVPISTGMSFEDAKKYEYDEKSKSLFGKLSPNGERLIVVDNYGKQILFFCAKTLVVEKNIEITSCVMDISVCDTIIAFCHLSGIFLWNLRTLQPIVFMKNYDVGHVALLNNGKKLLACTADSVCLIYKIKLSETVPYLAKWLDEEHLIPEQKSLMHKSFPSIKQQVVWMQQNGNFCADFATLVKAKCVERLQTANFVIVIDKSLRECVVKDSNVLCFPNQENCEMFKKILIAKGYDPRSPEDCTNILKINLC